LTTVMSPAARALPRGIGVGPVRTRTDAGARVRGVRARSDANKGSENLIRLQDFSNSRYRY
jgi:hypothetical protein